MLCDLKQTAGSDWVLGGWGSRKRGGTEDAEKKNTAWQDRRIPLPTLWASPGRRFAIRHSERNEVESRNLHAEAALYCRWRFLVPSAALKASCCARSE